MSEIPHFAASPAPTPLLNVNYPVRSATSGVATHCHYPTFIHAALVEVAVKEGTDGAFAAYRKWAEHRTLRIICWFILPDSKFWSMDVVHALRRILGVGGQTRMEFYPDDIERGEVVRKANLALQAFEASPPEADGLLFKNIRMLGEHLGMSVREQELLALRIMARLDTTLRKILESTQYCDDIRLAEVLGAALDAPVEEMLLAIASRAPLVASGLLHVDRVTLNPIEKLSPMEGLSGILTKQYLSFEELFFALVRPASQSTLCLEDFSHIHKKAEVLIAYAGKVCAQHSSGRNVLLYGPPGTGKTELARLVIHIAGLRGYEGDVADPDGQPLDVNGRLRALTFVQRMVHFVPKAIVIVDEVEDIFKPREGPEPEKRTMAAGDSKGWSVQLLETNPTPTIWISNRVSQIDAAILRRFDLVLEIPVAPLQMRCRILERSLNCDTNDSPGLTALLQDAAPAPAILTRAAAVATALAPEDPDDRLSQFKVVLEGHLRAQGYNQVNSGFVHGLPFDGRFLNSVPGSQAVIDVLANGSSARLLVYGPSGTGKTAFANYAAQEIGAPLRTESIRSLLGQDPFEFDQNLQRAFERAHYDGAVLLLDDMDWLVSIGQEPAPQMLRAATQLKAYLDRHSGRIICTIIAADRLDPAFLRRFTFRMKTGYLDADSSVRMLSASLQKHAGPDAGGAPYLDSQLLRRVSRLESLTPGDIDTALRCGAIRSERQDASEIVDALEELYALKTGRPARQIGFMETRRVA